MVLRRHYRFAYVRAVAMCLPPSLHGQCVSSLLVMVTIFAGANSQSFFFYHRSSIRFLRCRAIGDWACGAYRRWGSTFSFQLKCMSHQRNGSFVVLWLWRMLLLSAHCRYGSSAVHVALVGPVPVRELSRSCCSCRPSAGTGA
jgi:hypothetical protein